MQKRRKEAMVTAIAEMQERKSDLSFEHGEENVKSTASSGTSIDTLGNRDSELKTHTATEELQAASHLAPTKSSVDVDDAEEDLEELSKKISHRSRGMRAAIGDLDPSRKLTAQPRMNKKVLQSVSSRQASVVFDERTSYSEELAETSLFPAPTSASTQSQSVSSGAESSASLLTLIHDAPNPLSWRDEMLSLWSVSKTELYAFRVSKSNSSGLAASSPEGSSFT